MEPHILILAGYCYPEQAASSYLGQNRNQVWVDEGFKIEIITPTPCRGLTPEMRKQYSSPEYKHEQIMDGGVTIHRFSMYAEGKNSLLRALRYALCGFAHIWKGIFSKPAKDCNVMFIPSTPPIAGAIAAIVKKCTGKKFVYNLQDIFPDSLVNNGLTKKGSLLWKIGRVIENFTYRDADKIIVISNDFKENIMAKGVPEEKIEVIYNWVDQNAVVDIPREENKLFDKYGLSRDKFYITYSGNIGLSQNMDMLLNVAKKISETTNIHFVLIGEGAYKAEVEKRVKEENIKNVTLLPFQPYEDISHVFSLGDMGLVISKPGTGAASVPSKTWSIMSASRPVLANFDENELKTIIEQNKCGVFTKAGDENAFIAAILNMYKDCELCKEYGRNGRQFVMDNLTKEVGTQKYVDVIKSVVAEAKKHG